MNWMDPSCDTMVALPSATAGGEVVFAKNSDRPQDECQPLVMQRRATHREGEAFRCLFVMYRRLVRPGGMWVRGRGGVSDTSTASTSIRW